MDKSKLAALFDHVDEDKRAFALDTLDEYVLFRERIARLQELPMIRVNKNRPEVQQLTPASKLIKEYSQVVDAKRGTLLRILYRVESSAADELAERLAEVEA